MLKEAQFPVKKRLKLHGFDISIESPKGSIRRWKDPHGKETGHTKMHFDYGYFRRTEGTDGDHVDVYVGPDPDSAQVFIVNQMKKPDFKEFDEHKCLLGFKNPKAAKAAYLMQYDDPRFFGSMKEMGIEDFKEWVFNKKATKKQASEDAGCVQPLPDRRVADTKLSSHSTQRQALLQKISRLIPVPQAATSLSTRGKSASSEDSVHGRVVDSEVAGNHLDRVTGVPPGDAFLDRPQAGAAVSSPVFDGGQKLKVAQLVVQTVPVSMMDHFVSTKRASKAALHHDSVLQPLPSPVVDQSVGDLVERSLMSASSRSPHEPKYAQHTSSVQESDMPFTSKRQQRAAFGGHIPGISKEKAREWAHETPDIKKLPDRAPAEKGEPTLRSKKSEFVPLLTLPGVRSSYLTELNLSKFASDEGADEPRGAPKASAKEILGEKIRGLGDNIPPQTDFARAVEGDDIKVAKDDRVGRIADRVDDVGIGVLAAPYAADFVGHRLAKMKNPRLAAAGHALSNTLGNDSLFGKSHARELVGLGLVAPGITHRVAKGIDKVMPEKKANDNCAPVSREISKERKAAAIEKIATSLYPDFEYLPIEKQADIVAQLGRLAQKGKGLVRGAVGGAGHAGIQTPGAALMSHLGEGARSFGRDMRAIPSNIAEAVGDVGGKAVGKLQRRFAAGERLERIRQGGFTPGLIGGGAGPAAIPATRAHPAMPVTAAHTPAPAAPVAAAADRVTRPAHAHGVGAAPAPAHSTGAQTAVQKVPAAPASPATGPYRDGAAPVVAAPPVAVGTPGPTPAPPAAPSTGRRLLNVGRAVLPAAAAGTAALGLGGAAVAGGYGLSRLQGMQEEATTRSPPAPPVFVGQGRVS